MPLPATEMIMRKLTLVLLAAAGVALAAPALAHAHDEDDDWSVESYGDFGQQYQHIWRGIEHGLSDGSFTPGQARYFYRALRGIQGRADWEYRTGRFDPDEISARLDELHERMHVAHQRGHERMDDDWYGYQPYGWYRR
jgi:hypothetical protein